MENDEYRQAEIDRIAAEMKERHSQEAFRKTAEIMERLDIQALNSGINKSVNPTSLEAAVSMVNGMKQDQGKMMTLDPNTYMYKMKDRYGIDVAKPNYNITFQNTVDGKQVVIGKIDFNGGTMKFEGNFEESAVKFMDHLAANFKGRLNEEHISAAKVLLELVTLELESEIALDDVYRKGFNDGMATCRAMLRRKIQQMEKR